MMSCDSGDGSGGRRVTDPGPLPPAPVETVVAADRKERSPRFARTGPGPPPMPPVAAYPPLEVGARPGIIPAMRKLTEHDRRRVRDLLAALVVVERADVEGR